MTVSWSAPRKPADHLLVFAAICAGLLVAARVFPFETVPVVVCPLRAIAHIPCPSCGMTRAWVRVTHFDLPAALHVSPLGTILALAAVLLVAYALSRLTWLRRAPELQLTPAEARVVRVGAIATVALNWGYLLVTRAAG